MSEASPAAVRRQGEASRPHGQPGMVVFPPATAPLLLVVIDCEEDFDWRYPVRDTRYRLESTQRLAPVQKVFAEAGLVPTYVVGYPIVDDAEAWRPLAALAHSNECQLGAHLHPWVTPPLVESNQARNSFPGNLPAALEHAKLVALTDRITARFGFRPRIYKAGRYGFGTATAAALSSLGFEIDLSFMPGWNFETLGGPSFMDSPSDPFWLGPEGKLLEIPITAGFTGIARHIGPPLFRRIDAPQLRRLHLQSLLARAGVLNRVRLSPEGIKLHEAIALTRVLFDGGQRVFQMSFHSTSLVPGSTQYVADEQQLTRLLDWIAGYLDFFCKTLGGTPTTPQHVLALARQSASFPPTGTEAPR